jgi:hypothetical protein
MPNPRDATENTSDFLKRRYADPTPNDVAAENVGYFLGSRGISRRELAQRMNALGLPAWKHEKTVRRVLDAEKRKRITTDELVALALALETTVETLLTPGVEHYVEDGSGDLASYKPFTKVGDLSMTKIPFLSVISSRSKSARPTPHEIGSLPARRLLWEEWDRDRDEGRPPRFAGRDPETEFLASMRSDIRRLYESLELEVPDDLDTSDVDALNDYFRQAVKGPK